MLEYYEQRQPEYEKIYSIIERQDDLAWLQRRLEASVLGRRVLEAACGTGYWTRRIANAALYVLATDASEKLAKSALESCEGGHVDYRVMDAFQIPDSSEFDVFLAGFFFSHIKMQQRRTFMKGIDRAMKPGSKVILFDNRYIEGSSTPISSRSEYGDTFQTRTLDDGSAYEVLKNFPDQEELEVLMEEFCHDVSVEESDYFWLAMGTLK
ncbi:Ubiquinone/menaquinone biosynthesis C-methyltransferase UbiE [Marinomonas spartinae]|uniref:Ubiquinone/menaquinone biosynthesis C-methyltransferase UbiE n=1 Tax=Marinomonas spartinae TaxID=1792290 RepID=A0A1A8TU91_9GAMM|nr:class I SAM-dependent methyltransferase [Marinomonas spartinae]SBS36744.1 Ubiquinone/menaquinone biosynthesis C-methyltransferase UbiE [Marinomonas spartinae]SBS38670.1 Ubiquinone/menaquinone biosynthesis C-methyltransferase UbiE [Marinomonas spartinae]